MSIRKNIKFEWAIKRQLRDKANYGIIEGFLSELLREDVTILNIGESDDKQDSIENIFNCADIIVKNNRNETFLIELQNISEADCLFRMEYGKPRTINSHIRQSDNYRNVSWACSINIVYFDMGHGNDYVYWRRGKNGFSARHIMRRTDECRQLQLSAKQKAYFDQSAVGHLDPDYCIIMLNSFDGAITDSLDEWIYYLKHDMIFEDFKAKGLPEARKILRIDALSTRERASYYRHIEMLLLEKNAISDAKNEGFFEGRAEGEAKRKALEKEKAEREAERKALEAALEKEKAEREALEAEIAKLKGCRINNL
jgi:hypothetical protein